MTRITLKSFALHAHAEVFRIVALRARRAPRFGRPHRARILATLAVMLTLACLTIVNIGCDRKHSPVQPPSPTATTNPTPRIVVLSPALAIILKDLGLAPAIVGRHAWDLALDPALPVCGDQSGVDFEALLRVRPTHVVVQWGERALPQRLVELAKEQGWTLINENPLSLDDIPIVAKHLDHDFEAAIAHEHAKDHADALIASLVDACGHRVEDATTNPRTPSGTSVWKGRILLLAATSPPAALGPGSWHYEILSRLGGTNAITSGGPYQTLDAEDVTKLAPDGIVILQPRGMKDAATPTRHVASEFEPADLKKRMGQLADLSVPAITNGRIALIDDPFALTPSSSIIEVRLRLKAILGAWSR